jgi:hypothetical protein
MTLFGLLRRFMSRRSAILCFAFVYAVLITATILLLPTPIADFRYGRY